MMLGNTPILKKLVCQGLAKKVLFGSDIPINKVYFPNVSTGDYLNRTICDIKLLAPAILSYNLYYK